MLVEQRRGLFFKIPYNLIDELQLWSLIVFTGAPYLRGHPREAVTSGLVRGFHPDLVRKPLFFDAARKRGR